MGGVRSSGVALMLTIEKDILKNDKMIGNNNTQQYTTPNYTIVWIGLTLPLHTINPYGEEGIVELGDDRRGNQTTTNSDIY